MKRATVGAIQSTVTGVFIVSGRTLQPKKKMGFGKKLIIILAVIVAFLGVCSLMIVHQNNQLEKKFYQVKSNKVVDNKANRWEVYTSFTPAI